MIQAKDLKIDMESMTKNQYLAVEAVPNYPYIDGKRSETADGYKTTVVMPTLKFEKLVIKTPEGVIPPFTNEEIPTGGIPVIFDNLVVTPYINNGQLGLSAKAKNIFLLENKK